MKNFKTIFIAAALVFGSFVFAQAQESKIAHINTQELIEAMPGYTSAMSELEKLQNTYSTSIEDMMKEATSLSEKYQAEATMKTDEENANRARELEQTQGKIIEYRQNAARDLQKKEAELLKPVFEKARAAIKKVANEKGFDYVMDSTQGSGLIVADGYNLMPDVKKELGIQ
ncbi:MAG TPA: OmpH family outer membrane protein [Flavobacteriaceae bacterium]|nr:OmpH family outer membrane protein [Flavobacteriaceae bacterium]